MAALVQSFPQQTGTVTMLQTRPSSSSGTFSTSQSQQHQQSSRGPQLSRSLYNLSNGSGSYRGHTSLSPVAPYAFTSTPSLTNSAASPRQNQTPHLRPENRTSSAPVIPQGGQNASIAGSSTSRQRYPAASSTSTSSTSTSPSPPPQMAKDDTSIPTRQRASEVPSRPLSTINMSTSSSVLSANAPASPVKPSPDRYRRGSRRAEIITPPDQGVSSLGGSAAPSGSGMATVGHLYSHPGQSSSSPSLQSYQSFRGPNVNAGSQTRLSSVDDLHLTRPQNLEQAKRNRRRSMGSLETASLANDPNHQAPSPHPNTFIQTSSGRLDSRERRIPAEPQRPVCSHTHNGSSDSVSSTRSTSRPSSSRREPGVTTTMANQASVQATPVSKQEVRLVNVAPRTPDANKRLNNPSPLSKPMTMSPESPSTKVPITPNRTTQAESPRAPMSSQQDSPAAQQLTALSKKEEKKSSKSRLRRAFSFGSASELRRASAQNNLDKNAADRTRLHKERHEDFEAEQAAIAQKQEASGLGESIYSGQGQFFTGSTDNLSISSTASSASIMLRKMGEGVKKSTRSLVGLFRPKSVVGVPPSDSAIEPSVAQVSMVTVEAEREKVNVNPNPHDQAGGGTGFPKLERNSIDAGRAGVDSSRGSNDNVRSRRSIVGGERERAEVLAAVKKGILKRSGTDSGNSSPITRPLDATKTPDFNLPNIPHVNDSPRSSAPSTPADEQPPRSGHRRTDSIAIEGVDGDDYFSQIARFVSTESKSGPMTPQTVAAARNISFSPRIQFHDTWPSGEYDRRGEIATCNRLTPMLAQQIKEELNTFKMEMEVHESSKVYTHFF